jgi:hypothetical protein
LQSRGVNRIDHFVLTHGDIRHVGGATNAIADFSPRQIWLNPLPQRSPPYRRLEDWLTQRTIQPVRPLAGDKFAPWTFLHPTTDDDSARADATSLVMQLNLNGITVLHVPDLDEAGWRALIERHPGLRTDILLASPVTGGQSLGRGVEAMQRAETLVVIDTDYPATERLKPRMKSRLGTMAERVFISTDVGATEVRFEGGRASILTAHPPDGQER